MCTLIVARNHFAGFPLVIAANRDELLDRPSEPPTYRKEGRAQVLAPRDLQRGGTWMAVSETGLFVGITNRAEVQSQPDRMTRGSIVTSALWAAKARNAADLAGVIDETKFNGFNLVIADAEHVFVIRGDGKAQTRFEFAENGLLVVTNQGIGRVSAPGAATRVANVISAWRDGICLAEKFPEDASPLLGIHSSEPMNGTCINLPEHNYGTRSSAIIRLAAARKEWQYWHRERPDDGRCACSAPFSAMMTLPIVEEK